MKGKWFFLAGLISYTLWAQTDQVDSLFRQGNKLYHEGKYAEAEQLYKQILDKTWEAPELYYNLGNNAYKQNRFSEAVYYYEKALKLNPGFEPAKENLKLAKRNFHFETKTLPETFFKKLWKKIVLSLPAEVWGFMSLVVLYFSLFLWLVFLFSEQIKVRKTVFYILPFSFILWLFFLLASYSADRINSKWYAIVMSKQVDLYASPSFNAEIKGKAFEGQKVEVLQETEYWSRIKMPDGKIYWIPKDSYKSI